MNYRTTTLLARSDIGPAGTKTIPINVDQPISRIMLEWQVLKASVTMHSYPHADISKIELVDGSDVLFAMDGGQAQALNILDRKCGSMTYGKYINANVQVSYYGIDFGRFLWDPVLAFDPKRFKNPQLKVTYSEIISDTSGSAGSLEVLAEVFDEKIISPIGFLMSKEHHSYVPQAHGTFEYIDLPTDFPYRKFLIQGYGKGIAPYWIIDEARLNEDNEKRIPFDWDLDRYYQHRRGVDSPVVEHLAGQATAFGAAQYLTGTDFWATLVTNGALEGDQPSIGNNGAGGYFLVSSAVSAQFQAIHHGFLPNHCFHFPFGDEKDIDDWYDVTKIGHLQLRLAAGGAGANSGTAAVILQQLRRY